MTTTRTAAPNPQYIPIGALAEFLSDRYTDKGPATGEVVNSTGQDFCVRFHDEYHWFSGVDVEVVKVVLRDEGTKHERELWQFR